VILSWDLGIFLRKKQAKEDEMAVQIDFAKFTDEELFDLNKRLVEHIKARHQARSQTAIAKFHVGDRVQFKTPEGELIKGTIIRINRKTVTLHSDDHLHWKVSAVLLQKASHERMKKNNLLLFAGK
jgi:hypothetical protein